MIDYYQILGVHPSATLDEIKRAYRQKALQCHPDRGGTHAQMLEINEAFGVLEDAELRQQYDYARAHNEDRKAQQQAATAHNGRAKLLRITRASGQSSRLGSKATSRTHDTARRGSCSGRYRPPATA